MPESLEGLSALQNTLATLRDRSAKKAAKAGVNAGLAELVKEIKARVNGLAISGELKAALRKTVNKRLKKKEGQDWTGKAGFGVGKQSARKIETAHERNTCAARVTATRSAAWASPAPTCTGRWARESGPPRGGTTPARCPTF